ncbi:tripartite tricarboxylate transporter TctB family protein [Photobacterium rosenbergii]|nr:tripartite tricarboxylate transporter TctB family protein [Photobacterium rosenbergii]
MRFWFSVSTFLFSVGFTLYGLQTLDIYDFNNRPGAGYFPLIIGVGLVITTGINVYKDIQALKLQREQQREQQQVQHEQAAPTDEQAHYQKDALVVAVCIALLIFSISTLGAIVSMVVFCLAFLSYFNRGKHIQNISYSIVFPLCVYLLFDVWLQAGLPDGFFRHFY